MTANHRPMDTSDVALIEKVKATPQLYDPSNPDFKFAHRKEQLWETVGAVVEMSAVDARRRWTVIRDRYSRELRKLRLQPEKYEFGYSEFFKHMDFLRKFVRRRKERRREPKFKFDCSWDGSNDEASKMHNRSEIAAQSEDEMYEATQDQYDPKLEVANTTEGEEGFPEFVEVNGPIHEGYEEYVEHHPVQNANSAVKYSMSTGGATPRHHQAGMNTSVAGNVIPISFLNSSGGTGGSTQYTMAPHKTPANSSTPKQNAPDLAMGGGVDKTEDDFFCKTIGSYLRQLSRRHKIKAKVEMFQILEKYIEIEENADTYREERKG